MNIYFSLLAPAMTYLVWRHGTYIDRHVLGWTTSLQKKLEKPIHPLVREISLIQELQGYLRAGQSLQNTMELLDEAKRDLLQKNTTLSDIIQAGLSQGTPILEALANIKKSYASKLRSDRKARSLTSQARVQAHVAAFLPCLLFAALAWIDPQFFAAETSALFLLFIAALLDFSGIFWMRRIFSRAFFPPNSFSREIEEYLPQVLLNLIGKISIGTDIATAYEASLPHAKTAPCLRQALESIPDGTRELPISLRQVLSVRDRALRFGTPARAELLEILDDIEQQREARWEEAAQLLPLQMLIPLFLCIFPANLCVLAIPVLGGMTNF